MITRKEVLIQKLNNVPEETELSYPYEIRKIIAGKKISKNSLILKDLRSIVDDSENEEKLRFDAFYTLQVILWRLKEYQLYRENVDLFETEFKRFKFYDTFRSQYYSSKGNSVHNSRMAIEFSEKAAKNFRNSPNVLNLFALTVVNHYELRNEKDIKYLELAERQISRAISLSKENYAMYFSVRSRIYLLLENFEKAREDIRLAIEKEPSDNKEYPIRIGEYQEIKSRISNSEYLNFVKTQQEKAMSLFDGLRIQMVQLLGLLTAIIAFIITTVNISQSFDFESAYKLIIVNGLVCVVIFSCFHLVFIEKRISSKTFTLILVCVVFIFLVLSFDYFLGLIGYSDKA